jgi:pantoate--beta-alanine ligase
VREDKSGGSVRQKTVQVVRTVKDLRKAVALWRKDGETVALVPTMGALHDGHLSLVALAKAKAARAVVSIFVNPTQFGPHEDLGRYPRDEAGDVAKLTTAGTDLVWAPERDEMYPQGFATRVEPGGAALGLEGEFRPHHFDGVATVCCKLFSAVAPDLAVFGEKDYQQLCVIRQMVRDLNLAVRIVAGKTVREADGLALSSRNAYLTPQERAIAPALYRVIAELAATVRDPPHVDPRSSGSLRAAATNELERAGFTKVDYVAVCDAETLQPFDADLGREGRVLAAAWLGRTRLIDNVPV